MPPNLPTTPSTISLKSTQTQIRTPNPLPCQSLVIFPNPPLRDYHSHLQTTQNSPITKPVSTVSFPELNPPRNSSETPQAPTSRSSSSLNFGECSTTQNPEQGHEESKKESKLCEGKIRVEKHEKEAQQRDSWWVLSARGRKDEPRKAETISRERNFQECLIGVISFLGTPCSCVAISPWSSLESWAT